MLLLNRPVRYYPRLSTILVYPSTYRGTDTESLGPAEVQIEAAHLGESWHSDYVVLAWDAVQRRAARTLDAENVVLHEFAHQLDQENRLADGVPILPDSSRYAAWTRILRREYQRLRSRTARGLRAVF